MRHLAHLPRLILGALATLSCGGRESAAPDPATQRMMLVVQASIPDLPEYPFLAVAAVRLLAADGSSPGSEILSTNLPLNGATSPVPPVTVQVEPGRTTATRAVLEIELRGAGIPARAEWSARSDTFALRAGTTLPLPLRFGRGHLAMLQATTVRFQGERPLVLDLTGRATPRVDMDPGLRPFLYVLDPRIARIAPDSASVEARAAGSTAIVAMAGFRADTLPLVVRLPPASLSVTPRTVLATSFGDTTIFTFTVRDALGNELRPFPVPAGSTSEMNVAGFFDPWHAIATGNGEATLTFRLLDFPAIADSVHWVTRQRVAKIGLMPAPGNLAGVNSRHLLAAGLLDANGFVVAGVVPEWRVSGPASLAELPGGSATLRYLDAAGREGDVTVTVTAGGVERTARYHIAPGIHWIVVDGERFLTIGNTTRLTAVAEFENGERRPVPVRWTSENPAIATVDASGLVTARAEGTVVIRATSDSLGMTGYGVIIARGAAATLEWNDASTRRYPPVMYSWILLAVRALSTSGNLAPPGTRVLWSATGGELSPRESVTDAAGLAYTWWGYPPEGTYSVRATVEGTSISVSRTIKLLPTIASYLEVATAASDTARSGARLASQPVLQARDIYRNPLRQAGVPITVSVAGNTAAIAGTTVVQTDAQGVVRFTDLALSGSPGTHVLEFRAPDSWMVLEQKVVIVP